VNPVPQYSPAPGMVKVRVAKLRVGILQVEVRAKRAIIWVKCVTSECASRLMKDRRWQLESITSRTC